MLETFPNTTMTARYAGPAAGVTVAAVGRRWGWTSPRQFTAAYQRRFGEAPSRTMRI